MKTYIRNESAGEESDLRPKEKANFENSLRSVRNRISKIQAEYYEPYMEARRLHEARYAYIGDMFLELVSMEKSWPATLRDFPLLLKSKGIELTDQEKKFWLDSFDTDEMDQLKRIGAARHKLSSRGSAPKLWPKELWDALLTVIPGILERLRVVRDDIKKTQVLYGSKIKDSKRLNDAYDAIRGSIANFGEYEDVRFEWIGESDRGGEIATLQAQLISDPETTKHKSLARAYGLLGIAWSNLFLLEADITGIVWQLDKNDMASWRPVMKYLNEHYGDKEGSLEDLLSDIMKSSLSATALLDMMNKGATPDAFAHVSGLVGDANKLAEKKITLVELYSPDGALLYVGTPKSWQVAKEVAMQIRKARLPRRAGAMWDPRGFNLISYGRTFARPLPKKISPDSNPEDIRLAVGIANYIQDYYRQYLLDNEFITKDEYSKLYVDGKLFDKSNPDKKYQEKAQMLTYGELLAIGRKRRSQNPDKYMWIVTDPKDKSKEKLIPMELVPDGVPIDEIAKAYNIEMKWTEDKLKSDAAKAAKEAYLKSNEWITNLEHVKPKGMKFSKTLTAYEQGQVRMFLEYAWEEFQAGRRAKDVTIEEIGKAAHVSVSPIEKKTKLQAEVEQLIKTPHKEEFVEATVILAADILPAFKLEKSAEEWAEEEKAEKLGNRKMTPNPDIYMDDLSMLRALWQMPVTVAGQV